MKLSLTPKQKAGYESIVRFMDSHGYSPSIREICGLINSKSTGRAHKLVMELVTKGWLEKRDNCSRSLMISTGEKPRAVNDYTQVKNVLQKIRPENGTPDYMRGFNQCRDMIMYQLENMQ